MDTNLLYYGDNLGFLRDHARFPTESVDLIYLDPPFNSNREYHVIFSDKGGTESEAQLTAFEDSWRWGPEPQRSYEWLAQTAVNKGAVPAPVSRLIGAFHQALGPNDVLAYLVMMTPRLLEMHRILKPTGSLYLHCDPAASHYLKIVLDAIFGGENFRREIIWRSGWVSGFKAAAKNWVRNHDTILYYVKDLSAPPYFDKDKAYTPHEKGYERRGGGGNPKGVAMDDVWTEVALMSPWIKSFSKEKLGWRTQKPLELLKRIITMSCPPDGIVLDPFCGCGTAISAANALGRKWIGIDITHLAIAVIRSRLKDEFQLADIEVVGEPVDVEGARALVHMKDGRYQFQWWALSRINATPRGGSKKKGADQGVDGEMTFIEEGGDQKRVIVSVKSGGVNAQTIRDLAGARNAEQAEVGVLLTLEPPTKPMETAAAKEGLYHSPGWGKAYPRIQILTVEQLLAGEQPDIPPAYAPHMTAQAREQEEIPGQTSMEVET